jgi:2-methylcitrate dehydratase PrpD
MLLGLDADGIAKAFGVALSQSAGSLQFLHEGGWTKRSHVGQAAMNGVIAATMAHEGFRGAIDPLEGKIGFLNSYAPNPNHSSAIEGVGDVWELLNVGVKPYPSCRYSHAPLDAIVALRDEHNIQPEEINRVIVGVSKTGWNIIGDSDAKKHNPKSIVDGQFSMPFCAAVALQTGGLGWDDYNKYLTNKDTLDLCKRVTTVVDDKANAAFPTNMAGNVVIETSRGTFDQFIDMPKGEPGNFVTDEELMAKFTGLTAPYIEPAALTDLSSGLLDLDTINSVSGLLHHGRQFEAMA